MPLNQPVGTIHTRDCRCLIRRYKFGMQTATNPQVDNLRVDKDTVLFADLIDFISILNCSILSYRDRRYYSIS